MPDDDITTRLSRASSEIQTPVPTPEQQKAKTSKVTFGSIFRVLVGDKVANTINELGREALKTLQQAANNARGFIIGNIGRLSPELETKLRPEKDRVLQEQLEGLIGKAQAKSDEITDLKQQLKNLDKESVKKYKHIESKSLSDGLNDEILKTQGLIRENNLKKIGLELTIEKLEKKLKDLKDTGKQGSEEYSLANKGLLEKQEELAKLPDIILSLKEKLKENQEALVIIDEELDSELALNAKKEVNQIHQEKRTELTTQIKECETDLKAINQEIDQALDNIQGKSQGKPASNEDKSLLATLNKNEKSIKEEIQQLETKVRTLEGQLTPADSEQIAEKIKTTLENESQKIQEEIHSNESLKAKNNQQIESNNFSLEFFKISEQKELSEINDGSSYFSPERKEILLQDVRDRHQILIDDIQNQLDDLNAEQEKIQKNLQELNNRYEEIKQDLDEIKENPKDFIVSENENEGGILKRQLEEKKQDLEDIQNRIRSELTNLHLPEFKHSTQLRQLKQIQKTVQEFLGITPSKYQFFPAESSKVYPLAASDEDAAALPDLEKLQKEINLAQKDIDKLRTTDVVLSPEIHEDIKNLSDRLQQLDKASHTNLSQLGAKNLETDLKTFTQEVRRIEEKIFNYQDELMQNLLLIREELSTLDLKEEKLIVKSQLDASLIMETKERTIGKIIGPSSESKESLDNIITILTRQSANVNAHEIIGDIIESLSESKWAQNILKGNSRLLDKLNFVKKMTGYELRRIKKELENPALEKQDLKEIIGTLETENKNHPERHSSIVSLIKKINIAFGSLLDADQKAKLEQIANAAPSNLKAAENAIGYVPGLASPPRNTELQNHFLLAYRGYSQDMQEMLENEKGEGAVALNNDKKSHAYESEALFNVFNVQFSSANLYEKREMLHLAQKWLQNPHINGADFLNDHVYQQFLFLLDQAKAFPSLTIREMAEKLENTLEAERAKDASQVDSKSLLESEKPKPGTILFQKTFDEIASSQISAEERKKYVENLAEDIRKMDAHYFSHLTNSEFVVWDEKKGGKELSPILFKYIESFNRLSHFISEMILAQNDPEKRARIVEFFIDVQEELLDPSKANESNPMDMNGAMAIHSALFSSEIGRLKTLTEISPEHLKKKEGFAVLLHPERSNKNAREWMNKTEYCIPYQGIILSDLMFIDEGNASKISDGQILNSFKIDLQGVELGKFFSAQKRIEYGPQAQLFFNTTPLTESDTTDKERYERSLQVEPRQRAT